MPKITRIVAREILDSRATPTIEASVLTDLGSYGTASVPSGAGVGKNEDVELRDNDPKRYHGKGVLKAVSNIQNIIEPKLLGIEISAQEKIDQVMIELDGTTNESKLGANAILAVSIACLKAAANSYKMPLFKYIGNRYRPGIPLKIPGPIFNLINGGKHGAGNLDFQEFHVIPSTQMNYHEALRTGTETWTNLKTELIHRNAIHSVGDEGGFAPNLFTNADALELMAMVIKNSSYRIGQDIFLGLDVAADSFYKNGEYNIKDSPKPLSRSELTQLYLTLVKDYGLFGLEDPLEQEDWSGWTELSRIMPPTVMIIADDLITTNAKRLQKAIDNKSCNAVIVKPNQIGSVTETIELIRLATTNHITTIASHRSGETNDYFIADFAVGMGANYAKFGAPDRGERVAKYNRLLEIEAYLKLI
ncbi:phosphopyruvate hydratase [Candidatus Collierbacteria bacterium CG10_big_fil_rev_8_21_14_0_10_44_9]|uniref:Enolase n=1 Tax=Candidatus Collierbacteria bacterium CG10_big_fil_rev_8_21_14_0_10_44_9 TaxID=1974535 RepID=A0A2H0VJE0_9BACT|nr:MAG: phosphopyruvate hydratase [Candidatus Collierbacteria bacterium CG10_big_fil_rev_8_21_14_0_10_44_9]